MRIEVVNTGTELLLGTVINTHAGYFGQELFKLGLRIQRQVTIPDGDDIRRALEYAIPRADVILVTGGLGPTSDDITREVVADMLGRDLVLDEAIRDIIHGMFQGWGRKPDSSNDRQAMVPVGATVLENPNGTAPGLYFPADPENNSPHIFLMPGPPRELKPMFQDQVFPQLASLLEGSGSIDTWSNFRIYGIGESSIAGKLDPIFESNHAVEIGYCARLGEVDVRLIGQADAIKAAEDVVREVFPHEIVAESEESIEEVVVDLLDKRGQTMATAESCTGGEIVSTITNVPGSSNVLNRGYVTYANEAKVDMLGVAASLIEAHGAVSGPVASAMAEGCLRESGADHAIAVTGIAGPGGGSDEKPVGTVYVALASQHSETYVKGYFKPTDRISFKLRVTRLALDLLRRRLLGFPLD